MDSLLTKVTGRVEENPSTNLSLFLPPTHKHTFLATISLSPSLALAFESFSILGLIITQRVNIII